LKFASKNRVTNPQFVICELIERTFEGSDFGHNGEAGLVEK